MNISTIRSAFGFFGTMLRKWTGIELRGDDFVDVYNYRLIALGRGAGHLHTSGQPTEAQFRNMQARGIDCVVNLLPNHLENALPGEDGLLADLGIEHVYIPVDFKAPKEAEYAAFTAAMDARKGQDIWIHCAANMRVSAFLYRYRRDVLGDDEAAARADMNAIWEPFGAWRRFLKKSG